MNIKPKNNPRFLYSLLISGLLSSLLISSFSSIGQISPDEFFYVGQFSQNLITPGKIAADDQGNIYVNDNNLNGIHKYDINGDHVEFIPLSFSPVSLAVDHLKNIYVGDYQTGIIYKIDPFKNIFLFTSECLKPVDLEFDPFNNLYVTDSGLKQILVFDISANLIKRIGEGTLLSPSCTAFDKLNNRIYVGEHGGLGTGFTPVCKVWIFNTDGELLGSFGSYGSEEGQFYRIQGISVGKCNLIYICEPYQGNILVFDQNGVYLTQFSEYGALPGQLDVPLDICYDGKDRILISSMNNGSVEIFNLQQTFPTATIFNSDTAICSGNDATINVKLTGTPPWSLTYTHNGINPQTLETDQSVFSFQVSDAGIYEISQLSDANYTGTCFSGSALIIVTDNIPSVNMPIPAVEFCEGLPASIPVIFSGDMPWSFSYSVNNLIIDTITTTNNPFNLIADQPGIYQINSIIGNACQGTDISGTTNLIMHPMPDASFTSSDITFFKCQNESSDLQIEFTGNSPWSFTYMIDERDTAVITDINNSLYDLPVSNSGIYELILVNDLNCINEEAWDYLDVWNIPRSIPEFSFTIDQSFVTFTNLSQNADEYHWNFGDGQWSNEINPSHTYDLPGLYNVELTASNDVCTDSVIQKSVLIETSSSEEYIENLCVEISPNPSNGKFLLYLNQNIPYCEIEIHNIYGSLVDYKKIVNPGNSVPIHLSNVKNGYYLMTVKSPGNLSIIKIILNQ
jgi:PKD repeat protein